MTTNIQCRDPRMRPQASKRQAVEQNTIIAYWASTPKPEGLISAGNFGLLNFTLNFIQFEPADMALEFSDRIPSSEMCLAPELFYSHPCEPY
jgi:hypothetical protein